MASKRWSGRRDDDRPAPSAAQVPNDLLNCAIVNHASRRQQLDSKDSATAKLVPQPEETNRSSGGGWSRKKDRAALSASAV